MKYREREMYMYISDPVYQGKKSISKNCRTHESYFKKIIKQKKKIPSIVDTKGRPFRSTFVEITLKKDERFLLVLKLSGVTPLA